MDPAASALCRVDVRVHRVLAGRRQESHRVQATCAVAAGAVDLYEIVDEGSAVWLTTIILVAGGCSALIGIGQYSFRHYDNLDLRARSTLASI
jgi:hypothetical protein